MITQCIAHTHTHTHAKIKVLLFLRFLVLSFNYTSYIIINNDPIQFYRFQFSPECHTKNLIIYLKNTHNLPILPGIISNCSPSLMNSGDCTISEIRFH